MRQVFLHKGKVQIRQVDIPPLHDRMILVKVHYSFVSSGTEMATLTTSGTSLVEKFASNTTEYVQKIIGAVKENGLDGTIALVKEKIDHIMPLGYSCSGQVIAIGKSVKFFRVGDYVACAGAGFAYHADVITVPENLTIKIRNDHFLKQTSLTTIGAIALQGVRRAHLQLGEKVCIIGLGLIGQLTVQLAKLAGCFVIGVDIQENRLRLAQKLGADLVISPRQVNATQDILFATEHHGVDATIITAASPTGDIIQQAMHATRRKGRVILVGDVKLDFDREPFYTKEIDFLISCSYGPGRYDDSYEKEGNDYPYAYVRWTENRNMQLFAQLIEDGKITIDALISHEFSLNKLEDAYTLLQKGQGLGIVLAYTHDEDSEKNIHTLLNEKKETHACHVEFAKAFVPSRDVIKVGIVGAGGFAKVKLLPILSKLQNISIHSIIDIDITNAINVGRQYEAQRIVNDFHKFLRDDDAKVAIIATPHVLHAEQAMCAMRSGKAVFVEKPAAVNADQLLRLKDFFSINKDCFYCVDFNRSYSPFMTAIKEVIIKRHNPMLIHYRMNAGYIPKNHWVHLPENGGRIIGEACHIFELFCFLTDAKPVTVSVEALNTLHDDVIPEDNFTANVRMSDGSCCSFIYSALGNHMMGKERMELFFDGKSIVMNDFVELRGYGLPVSFNKKVMIPEKGHDALVREFFKATRTPKAGAPISIDRILAATELSLIVDRLVRQGGGMEVL